MKLTVQKKTDQLNYEDFLGGVTRDVTIVEIRHGTKEQQYDIVIANDSRVWRPAVTVLKLLVAAWGDEASDWIGRRARLYGDPSITFGRDKVGGIRVSHLSNLPGNKPLSASLTETRGKRKVHTVQPLPDAPAPAAGPTPDDLAAQVIAALPDATTPDEVNEWGQRATNANLLDIAVNGVTVREALTARLQEVTG